MNGNPLNPAYLHLSFPNYHPFLTPTTNARQSHPSKKTPAKTVEQNRKQQVKGNKTMQADFPITDSAYNSHLVLVREGIIFGYLSTLERVSGRATLLFPSGMVANLNIFNG